MLPVGAERKLTIDAEEKNGARRGAPYLRSSATLMMTLPRPRLLYSDQLRQQLARYTSSPDVAMTALSLCSTYSPLDRALLGTKKVLPRSRSRLPTRRPRPAERSGHFCPRADTRTACALYALVQHTRKASVYTTTS